MSNTFNWIAYITSLSMWILVPWLLIVLYRHISNPRPKREPIPWFAVLFYVGWAGITALFLYIDYGVN